MNRSIPQVTAGSRSTPLAWTHYFGLDRCPLATKNLWSATERRDMIWTSISGQ
ncbi:MAG: hypothetical protein BMS9Abin07_0170 [Acidimicrobiia bacterium]|nr:MAG: hypothetical protein BMS9Abin07_0170 [Acidimicrobiia bacterium]